MAYMKHSDDAPLTIQRATSSTRVLLVHAPYPGRLKFDSQPSSLLCAAAPVVSALGALGRLEEVGYLDPGAATGEFYEELERIASGGSLKVVCISTSTAAIEEAARTAKLAREASRHEVLIIAGGPHEDDVEESMASRIPEVDISVGGDGEQVLWPIVQAYLDEGCSVAGLDVAELCSGAGLDGSGAVVGGRGSDGAGRGPRQLGQGTCLSVPGSIAKCVSPSLEIARHWP